MKRFLIAVLFFAIGFAIPQSPRLLDYWNPEHISFDQYLALQDPAPGILKFDAPKTCEVGELVRFETAGSTVNAYKWQIVPDSADFLVVEGGELAVFSGREPGTYTIIVAAATDNVVALHVHTLVVVSGDNTDPEHVVNRWLRTVKYDDITRKKQLVDRLATGFLSLSVDNSHPNQMIEKAAALNREVLGAELEKWEEFLVALQNFLDRKWEAGELTTTEDYQAVWRELAEALRSAKI